MTREEAIKILMSAAVWDDDEREALGILIPELKESEDERIRKEIIEFISWAESRGSVRSDWHQKKCPGNWIAYLEKQKDASKAIEAVERIDKYIDEQVVNAHDMKDSNPDKKYYRGWDDALGKMAGILQDVYSGEKQKESLGDFIGDFPYSTQKEQKAADAKAFEKWIDDWLEKQKEHKPNIELIQRSWYMEGYHDGEFGKEPKWIIKTGEGGPKYELNPRYGQPLAEQKPAECLKAERDGWYVCIKDYYRGGKKQCSVGDLVQAEGGMHIMGEEDISEWFRRAYYEEVRDAFEPNTDINMPEKPLEWSEEDELMRTLVIKTLEMFGGIGTTRMQIDWLKSLSLNLKKRNEAAEKLCSNEWSEEDERMLERAFHIIVEYSDIDEKESEVVQNWLKSFRERATFDDASGI